MESDDSGFSSGTSSGSSVPSGSGLGAVSSASNEVDTMRNAMIANFEQADLDVPAFLRKRGDVI